ncbi:MAG: peptidoglycan-binding protein [Minisyncoccia bacterium]
MTLPRKTIALLGTLLLPFVFISMASALTASCSGSPSASAITWSGSGSSGVAPYAFLWGNGATSSSQMVAAAVGTHTMTLQVTDASSTNATTTCSATIAAPQGAPVISSFTASPAAINAGQSSTLAWSVANASSTSINGGVGTVTGTSVSVSPSATTVYTLTAVNPAGTTTANATVAIVATSTPSNILAQLQALLAQIDGLKKQIAQLIIGQIPGGSGTGTTTPMVCGNFWRDLKRGDQGDDVRELQKLLAKEDPTLFPPGLVNGNFGPKTFAALKMMQRRFGIDVNGTGFFGMKSRTYFKSQCSDGDADRDGIINSADPDDDNDGTPDLNDRHPFNSNATSTQSKSDDDDKKHNGNNDNSGKGKGNNDDRDDD